MLSVLEEVLEVDVLAGVARQCEVWSDSSRGWSCQHQEASNIKHHTATKTRTIVKLYASDSYNIDK